MALLLFLFLNTNFAFANETIDNSNSLDENSLKSKNNINYSPDKDFILKDIPMTKISESEKKELRDRNPFFPPGSETLNTKSGINIANIDFKGIAMIGDSKVVFIETLDGSNAYEIGQNIGGGYTISAIDENELIVEISNLSKTHSIRLEKDGK